MIVEGRSYVIGDATDDIGEQAVNQHQLFIKTRSYNSPDEVYRFFRNQLRVENHLSEYNFEALNEYQPLLGYDNLVDILNYSQRYYTVDEVSQRLALIYRAVQNWNLLELQQVLDNVRFSTYLEVLEAGEDNDADDVFTLDESLKKALIKKMVLEQISSIVRPLRTNRDIKEKEINLVVLLNTV